MGASLHHTRCIRPNSTLAVGVEMKPRLCMPLLEDEPAVSAVEQLIKRRSFLTSLISALSHTVFSDAQESA